MMTAILDHKIDVHFYQTAVTKMLTSIREKPFFVVDSCYIEL